MILKSQKNITLQYLIIFVHLINQLNIAIKKIVSHAQVFGQCNNWLRENIPNAERVVVASTGEAARMAKEDKDICCIANSYAIELLQLNIHADNIQDRSDNKTRFLVIGKMVEVKEKRTKHR